MIPFARRIARKSPERMPRTVRAMTAILSASDVQDHSLPNASNAKMDSHCKIPFAWIAIQHVPHALESPRLNVSHVNKAISYKVKQICSKNENSSIIIFRFLFF